MRAVFERFTARAPQFVVLAQDEARTLGHAEIGAEHLLALAADEDAAALLADLGAEPWGDQAGGRRDAVAPGA